MDNVIKWCIDNMPSIICAFITLVTVIISVIRTPKNTAKVLLGLIEKLPSLILEAEEAGFIDGAAKYSYVAKLSIVYLSTQLGKSCDYVQKTYGDLISSYIENILATPQKHDSKEVTICENV